MQNSCHISVAALVEDQQHFLLVRQSLGNQWRLNSPGGGVEAGETLAQAAFRNTLEKTAWQVEIRYYLGLYIYQREAGGHIDYCHYFAAEPRHHDRHLRLGTSINAVLWLPATAIREQRNSHYNPLLERSLKAYLDGRRLPLTTIYQHAWPLQQG